MLAAVSSVALIAVCTLEGWRHQARRAGEHVLARTCWLHTHNRSTLLTTLVLRDSCCIFSPRYSLIASH